MKAANVISRFRLHHQAIIDAINQVMMNSRSYMDVKPNLRSFREALLNHYSQQNEELWNWLESSYLSDREASKMIDFLMHDLKEAKVKFLIFFDKYSGEMGDMGSRSFPKEFSDFSKEIQTRLQIEEEYLFPLLEKLS